MDKVVELAEQVERLRQQIVASLPNDEEALDALAHVKEAVTVLDDAADRILTAADEIKAAVPATAPHSAAVNKAYGNLIEACSFQDLTCQRLTKIRKILETVTDGLDKMQPFLSDGNLPQALEPIDEDPALLNGPALENEGMSQEKIDRMLEM